MPSEVLENKVEDQILDKPKVKSLYSKAGTSEAEKIAAVNNLLQESGIDPIDENLDVEAHQNALNKILEDTNISPINFAAEETAEKITDTIKDNSEEEEEEEAQPEIDEPEIEKEKNIIEKNNFHENLEEKTKSVEDSNKKKEKIELTKIETKFQTFLTDQQNSELIDFQTIKSARNSLNDPEAKNLLNLTGSVSGINIGSSVAESLAVGGAALKTASFMTSALAFLKVNAVIIPAKILWILHKSGNKELAVKGSLPIFGVFFIIEKLVEKHPELVNCFFAEKFSKRSKRKLEEFKNALKTEQAKESSNSDELLYLQKKINKYEIKYKQQIKNGMEYVPKWLNRKNKIMKIGGRIKKFFTAPFKRKEK